MIIITPNLTMAQACATQHREEDILEEQRYPPESVRLNLKFTAFTLYEPFIGLVGPIQLNSFWRGPKLNLHLGGAAHSAHLVGLAFDSLPTRIKLVQAMKLLALSQLPFQHALLEWGWLHLQAPERDKRPARLMNMSFGERDSKGSIICHAFNADDPRLVRYT